MIDVLAGALGDASLDAGGGLAEESDEDDDIGMDAEVEALSALLLLSPEEAPAVLVEKGVALKEVSGFDVRGTSIDRVEGDEDGAEAEETDKSYRLN